MHIKQFYLGCLAHASYLIGDEKTKTAAIIDPQRDIAQYLDEALRLGFEIKHVILTHFHADFIAGHLELRDRVGARIHLGAQARAEYEFNPLVDGDTLEFGDVRLGILETPGHTPEGISLCAFDLAHDEAHPTAVFTGDTLFVGDVGRPDLMASVGVTAEELAGSLYESLHAKLMQLPDETTVYPAHGAGSMCGKNLGSETFTTIGEQRRFNYALQPMSKEKFIEIVKAEQPQAPAYFGYDATMNKMERGTLDSILDRALVPLTLKSALELRGSCVQFVDVREADAFAEGHLKGSLNIGLDGKFATWAGTLLGREKGIVIIAEAGTEREAVLRLGRIGMDAVAGYLDGGIAALADRPDLVSTAERISVRTLAAQLKGGTPPIVVDVRSPREWEDSHIADSINIPLSNLVDRIAELPSDRRVALVCRTGYRSSTAASLLLQKGLSGFRDTIGGMEAWNTCELPVATLEAVTCQANTTRANS